MNPDPVIHHVELCVRSWKKSVDILKRYGFKPYLKRTVPDFCHQVVMKLNKVYFIVTEKAPTFDSMRERNGSQRRQLLTVLCPSCEDKASIDFHVDTVFNICFHVRNVQACVSRIENNESGVVIRETSNIVDQDGVLTYAIIKSICGNVLHTLINKGLYRGDFLPGFEPYTSHMDNIEVIPEYNTINKEITHIDHVTLCTYSGRSESVIKFYESCFGMKRVTISNSPEETTEDGLILKEGIGLKLRAMEYWRCAETGLACSTSRAPFNRMMLVVVESIPGQVNCNVDTFLREHGGPGVEHVALSTKNITETVKSMKRLTVKFRTPPKTYYRNLREMPEITEIEGLDLSVLEDLGILIDRENDLPNEEEEKPKFLMQIFALPIFDRQTFFIEIIQRSGGARGLGAKNVLALVRSIREDEQKKKEEAMRKAKEEEMRKSGEEQMKIDVANSPKKKEFVDTENGITLKEKKESMEEDKDKFTEKVKEDFTENSYFVNQDNTENDTLGEEKRDILQQIVKSGELQQLKFVEEECTNMTAEAVPPIRTC